MGNLRSRQRVVVLMIILGISAAACQPRFPDQVVVDGLPIGESVPCAAADCQRFIEFALADLEERDADHAPVVRAEAFVPDYRTADGQRLLLTRSGGSDLIIVLHLDDGSVDAVHVGCGAGIEPDRCFIGPPPGVIGP